MQNSRIEYMGYFDYEIDQSGNKRLVFLRAIVADSKKLSNSDLIYVNPTVLAANLSVPLEVIQSVLSYLEEREYVEISERPNHRLTPSQRMPRDDEEDNYVVILSKEFFAFYQRVEEVAPFLNANADISKSERQSTVLATVTLKNYTVPVVVANNITFTMPNMTTGSPLKLVTYGLANTKKLLTIEQLLVQKIDGLRNINEMLRKTLFGKDGPLSCFVSAAPRQVTFYQEAYINDSQLEQIRQKATDISE